MGRRKKSQSDGSSKNPLRVNLSIRQKDLPLSRKNVKKAVEVLVHFLKLTCEEISLFFVTEKKITSLHDQFFDDPTTTDCITFPSDSSYLGDCFICPKTAIVYAKKRNLDPYQETLLYMVHSILHLAGYDDMSPKLKRVMRKMEKKCMDHLEQEKISLKPR